MAEANKTLKSNKQKIFFQNMKIKEFEEKGIYMKDLPA